MNTNVPKKISNFFAFALVIIILILPFIFNKKGTTKTTPMDSLASAATSTSATMAATLTTVASTSTTAVPVTSHPAFTHPALIGKQAISLAISDTEPLREQGLSDTQNLNFDQGMLFVFDSPNIPQFWMKDMNYPLDMIWIDANKKIVGVAENVAPDTYPTKTFTPSVPIQYVIEAQAGFYKASYLKVGDTLEY